MRRLVYVLPVVLLFLPAVWGFPFIFLSTHQLVYGEQVTATGTLYRLDTNSPLPNETITLQISDDNSTWTDVGSCVTDTNGSCSVTFSPNPGHWYVRFYFAGDDTYASSVSNVEELNVLHSVTLSVSVPSQVDVGQEFNIIVSGQVDGAPANDLNVAVYRSPNGSDYNIIGYVVLHNGVGYLQGYESATGTYYYYAYFEGNSTYVSAQSPVATVSVVSPSQPTPPPPSGGGGFVPSPVQPSAPTSVTVQPSQPPVQPAAPVKAPSVPWWLVAIVVVALIAFLATRKKK